MAYAEKTGVIFNTQKFSIHDGTGIRTLIFMKGCPLRCLWCSNPESQVMEPEILDVKSNCTACGKCVLLCETHAIEAGSFDIDRSKCIKCGKCAEACYANAKKTTGRIVSVREMMQLIEKDRIFYTNSGGGVTIGGGEPVMQHGFVEALLKACKDSNIHTAIETCGYGKWDQIGGIFDHTDQVFFDLKAMDSGLHEKLTGVGNELILQNAERIAGKVDHLIFRIPLVPGCNDSDENIKVTGRFVKKLCAEYADISVEILPYHDLGQDKYRWLNQSYALKGVAKPEAAAVDRCSAILEAYGCNLITV